MVSVLMTSYNRENLITYSIESVLNQDYKNFEFIIVDDASEDNTWNIIKSFAKNDSRIKAFRNIKTLGDYPNRNIAASYASRKYIKYLDSDDLLLEGALGAMVKGMEKYPSAKIGFVGSNIIFDSQKIIILDSINAYRYIFFKGKIVGFGPSFTIICRKVFHQLGGFQEESYTSDFKFWLLILSQYSVCLFEASLIFWRQHNEQEFKKATDNKVYLLNSYHIYLSALTSDSCPISSIEKKIAIRNLKNRYSRTIIITFFTGKIMLAIKLLQKTSLKFSDLLLSLIPNQYPNERVL